MICLALACQPTVRAFRAGQHDRHDRHGRAWTWAAKCFEHDTSWTSGSGGTWPEALEAAEEHQREWAQVLARSSRLLDRVLPARG